MPVNSDTFGDMMASSFGFRVGWVLAAMGLAVACGGSSKSSDDDSGGKGGSGGTSGTTTTGGTGNTTSSGGTGAKGGTTSTGGTGAKGGTTSTGGSGGTTSGTSGSGGTTSVAGATGDPITLMTGNCPALTPCGGDVVGSWKISSICDASGGTAGTGGSTTDMPSCATQTVGEASSDVTFEFKSDGSFTAAGTITITEDETFDDACAMSQFGSDVATTCDLLDSFGAQGDTDYALSCTVANGLCDCHFTVPLTSNEVGTYTVDGDQITVDYTETDSDGTVTTGTETDSFCVKGDTMTQASTTSVATLTRN